MILRVKGDAEDTQRGRKRVERDPWERREVWDLRRDIVGRGRRGIKTLTVSHMPDTNQKPAATPVLRELGV